MKLAPDRLPAALTGALAPVYVIGGDEPLLVEESADAVRAAARRHGVPTPLADKLVELITGIEQGRLEQGGALGDALGALARPL